MAESWWRTRSNQVISAALEEGRAAGLAGFDLEKFVSAKYPFRHRGGHAYQIWLNAVSLLVRGERLPMATGRMVRPKHSADTPMFPVGDGPKRVHRFEPYGDHAWYGRLDIGDWLLVIYCAGRLKARTGNTRTGARVGPVVFDEIVCEPGQTPDVTEIMGFLSGCFDFSGLDLAGADRA